MTSASGSSSKDCTACLSVGELLRMIIENLDLRDMMTVRRVAKVWKAAVEDTAFKTTQKILFLETESPVLDRTNPVVIGYPREMPDASINETGLRTPSSEDPFIIGLRETAVQITSNDIRYNMFITEPPLNQVTVYFEMYYFEHPTNDHGPEVIVIRGSRLLLRNEGVRFRDISAVFQAQRQMLLAKGKIPFVDVLRSHVLVDVNIVNKAERYEFVTPTFTAEVVSINGRSVDLRGGRAEEEGWTGLRGYGTA